MIDAEILTLAEDVLQACRNRQWKIGTAESCTGGLIAGSLTAIAGSSDVVEGGIVSYSNEIKASLLGVPEATLKQLGAVNAEVARAMAEGLRRAIPQIDCAIAVTGIAGPGGGSKSKPVGLVHFGVATAEETSDFHCIFDGDRDAVRRATVIRALEELKRRANAAD